MTFEKFQSPLNFSSSSTPSSSSSTVHPDTVNVVVHSHPSSQVRWWCDAGQWFEKRQHKPFQLLVMPEFQDRLSYIDKRYDHLRKLTKTLKKKINELEDIMRQDNDEENLEQIRTLIEDIKREKQMMRDEAHIIRGELSQAMYNEDLRSHVLNFIAEFEEIWHDTPEKRLMGEIRRDEESSERRQSTSQGDDEVYTSSSNEYCTYRETSF